jgi:hypothetical protein
VSAGWGGSYSILPSTARVGSPYPRTPNPLKVASCTLIDTNKQAMQHLVVSSVIISHIRMPFFNEKIVNARVFLIFLSILVLTFANAIGQSVSTRNSRQITFDSDTLVLDSVSLVRGSVLLQDIDETNYKVDYLNGWIILTNPDLKGATTTASFRTYPYRLNKESQNRSLDLIEKRLYDPVNPFSVLEPVSPLDALFSDANLTTYGSISRGVSVGNTQDMVVNSNLNLQLSGKLDENIEIMATITDQNIPVQPEGNTAQLKEFDKIYVMLRYKNIASVLAGDIETKSTNGYFMRFTKQGQGLQGTVFLQDTGKKQDTTFYKIGLSGSMAKGTFRRQDIPAIESVQGPYQLRGINGESYIMVLAGSERVYINSELLKRGEDADYVINYNSGEITFTSRCMITKDKRIMVEFEYSDRSYARSVLHLNTEINRKRTAVRFNFYNEQDMKNQSNQLDLTDQQRLFLASIGNKIDNAYMLTMDSVAYQNNEVLYKMGDTLVAGIRYDSVFVYSTHKDSAYYRLNFTMVGQGKGDYILTQNLVNGRVYAWVAPVGGVSQGNYAPVMLLVTPKRTQMYSLALDYQASKNTFLTVEGAISNNDLNTFSSIGNKDNTGFGFKVIAKNTTSLHHNTPSDWKMDIVGYYEMKNANFRYIEDYREVSFARDYNLTDSMRYSTEHFGGISLFFIEDKKGKIGLVSNGYFIPQYTYMATTNHLIADFFSKGYKTQFDTKLLNNRQTDYRTIFLQNKDLLSKTFRFIEVGIANEMELNLYKFRATDSIMNQSFAFNEATFFVKNSDSLAASYQYGIRYGNRIEAIAPNGILASNAMAHTVAANFDFIKYINHQLRFNTAYRYLDYNDSTAENTLLASLDYQSRFLKGALQIGVFYEVGSSMEQKNEYAYLRVTDGQGAYQWIDYNQNGVEELNEFELSVYKDQANYIRIWLPSNQYSKTYNNQLTQSLTLRPLAVWRNATGFKKFVARFANLTTYRTQLKNTIASLGGMLNPFYNAIDDTALVAASGVWRNVLSFNQTSSIFGLDAVYNNAQNKTLTMNGFELSHLYSWLLSGRYTIKKTVTLKSEYQTGWIDKSSQYLQNRNYQIYYNSIESTIDYQLQTAIKMGLSYKYTQKQNKKGDEQSYCNNAGLEFNYSMPTKGNILLKATYYYILFKGAVASSSVAYEMLEALNVGHNGILNLIYQTRLWQNLQLNISYEGRVAEAQKMRHLGSVELRAYF